MKRLLTLIALGRMTERMLRTTDEPVYLKRWGKGESLRIDGNFPLTPGQARLIRPLVEQNQW